MMYNGTTLSNPGIRSDTYDSIYYTNGSPVYLVIILTDANCDNIPEYSSKVDARTKTHALANLSKLTLTARIVRISSGATVIDRARRNRRTKNRKYEKVILIFFHLDISITRTNQFSVVFLSP